MPPVSFYSPLTNSIFQTREFCQQRSKSIDIRVGVHTGIVLCGIVGGTKFKYGKSVPPYFDDIFSLKSASKSLLCT